MYDKLPEKNIFDRITDKMFRILDTPTTWFRERIVEPNRPKSVYYHRKFRRVPTVDQCDYGDVLCMYEADQQLIRNREVDSRILYLLRKRKNICIMLESHDYKERCAKVVDDYETALTNWFIQYGDLGGRYKARDVYMKQKHRLISERRQRDKELMEQNSSD